MLKEIEDMKAKHKQEFVELEKRLKSEKDQELNLQKAKYEKQIADLKAQFKKD